MPDMTGYTDTQELCTPCPIVDGPLFEKDLIQHHFQQYWSVWIEHGMQVRRYVGVPMYTYVCTPM